MDKDYSDKVALITGGGAGIGASIAIKLAALGATVIVVDVSKESAGEVTHKINNEGGHAVACIMDVGKTDQIESKVAEQVASHGRIDMLFNCAGVRAGFTPLLDLELDLWEETFRINLTSTLMFTKFVAKDMIRRGEGGQIINISSAVAFMNGVGGPAYACSKAALHHLTKTSATELAQHNIRVNSVSPGLVDTPGVVTKNLEEQVKPGGIAFNPMHRVIQPDEIADAALFLVSSEAKSITGQAIQVSGGGIM